MSKLRPVRQRTGASRQDEGPGTGAALLAGAVLGLATDAVALALPRQQARQLSAAHLAAAGGVYLGFAVADGRRSALLVQTGELLGFSALAALAVQRDSPGLLGAGWLAHVSRPARWSGFGQGRRELTVRSCRPSDPGAGVAGLYVARSRDVRPCGAVDSGVGRYVADAEFTGQLPVRQAIRPPRS